MCSSFTHFGHRPVKIRENWSAVVAYCGFQVSQDRTILQAHVFYCGQQHRGTRTPDLVGVMTTRRGSYLPITFRLDQLYFFAWRFLGGNFCTLSVGICMFLHYYIFQIRFMICLSRPRTKLLPFPGQKLCLLPTPQGLVRFIIMPTKIPNPLLFWIAKVTDHHVAHALEFLKAENKILQSKLPKQFTTPPQNADALLSSPNHSRQLYAV